MTGERLTDAELDRLESFAAEANTWVEDQEPDGDEDVGQTGWVASGEFFVPAPFGEHSATVRYIERGQVNRFVLGVRDALPKLIAEIRESRAALACPACGAAREADCRGVDLAEGCQPLGVQP